MKKLTTKIISFILTLSMIMGTVTTAFAQNTYNQEVATGIDVNGIYYTDEEFKELLNHIEPVDEEIHIITPRMAPAIAIPAWAIGKWVIPIAGAMVTVYVTPTLIKVGGKVIDNTSRTFKNILAAIKKVKQSGDEKKNYQLKADDFILKYRKASIRRQFPGEMLPLTVEEIQKKAKQGVRAAKTAWKLLNDGRFKK